MLEFTLTFEGSDADEHNLDFYDAAQAMIGFQRSLALTTHLVLNGEIITQAPSLKDAKIFAKPPQAGSWEIIAGISFLATAIYKIGTMPKNTPLGHLIYSAYDYVISETLGFHVDYDKSIGQQYSEMQNHKENELPILKQSQFDSLIEKCEYAIIEMHRPIVKSKTAETGSILVSDKSEKALIETNFSAETFEYLTHTDQTTAIEDISGRISSYNINTFKGRLFILDLHRSVPFMLAENARIPANIDKITRSLHSNAQDRFKAGHNSGEIWFKALRNKSRKGRLKSFYVVDIWGGPN